MFQPKLPTSVVLSISVEAKFGIALVLIDILYIGIVFMFLVPNLAGQSLLGLVPMHPQVRTSSREITHLVVSFLHVLLARVLIS